MRSRGRGNLPSASVRRSRPGNPRSRTSCSYEHLPTPRRARTCRTAPLPRRRARLISRASVIVPRALALSAQAPVSAAVAWVRMGRQALLFAAGLAPPWPILACAPPAFWCSARSPAAHPPPALQPAAAATCVLAREPRRRHIRSGSKPEPPPSIRPLQQPSRNHLRLNLCRALENIQNPRVAQHAADGVLQRKPVAAVDLQRVVGVGPGDAGGE